MQPLICASTHASWPFCDQIERPKDYLPSKNASKSLICSFVIAASSPSGISVRSRLFMSLIAEREIVSLATPIMARTMASLVSLWMRPLRVRTDVGFDLVAATAGFEHAIGVKDVAEEAFGGASL